MAALSPNPGPPEGGGDWIVLTPDALRTAEALAWAVVPACGGVVLFSGTVRDHVDDGDGHPIHAVSFLDYEAYEAPAVARMTEIAAEARRRWPIVGRIALLHRVGRLEIGETAVVVVVSAPHRHEAFGAARWCIDTIKASVPIWKKEEWAGGARWGGASGGGSAADGGVSGVVSALSGAASSPGTTTTWSS